MASSSPSFFPGLTPPQGIDPDPYADNDLFPYLVLSMTVCMSLTGTLMVVRCLTRWLLIKQWAWEDWLLLLSYAFYLAYSAILVYGCSVGAGKHQWDINDDDVPRILFLNNVDEIVYGFGITGMKLVLLRMYQHIFAPQRHTLRWWIIVAVMVINSLFYLGLTFAKIFLCYPRQAIWDKGVTGRCGSLFATLIASAIWNTASDLIILFMPIFFIMKLKLTTQKRFGLVAMFAVGAIAPIFSIVGIIMRVYLVESPDATHNQWRILLFAYAELTSGFICTCLPVLPRVKTWLKLRVSRGRSSASAYGGRHQPATSRDRRRSAHARTCNGIARRDYGFDARNDPKSSSYHELTAVGDIFGEPATVTNIRATGRRGPTISLYDGPAILKTTEVSVVQSDRIGYIPRLDCDAASDHSADTCSMPTTAGSPV